MRPPLIALSLDDEVQRFGPSRAKKKDGLDKH
jgi:hypothetical protein